MSINADDFLATIEPRARIRVSVLDPFWGGIKMLRENKYTLDQIQQYLKTNGVETTPANISRYIKSRKAKEETCQPRGKLNDGEDYLRLIIQSLLETAVDDPCFYGWDLNKVARGFLHEGIENYSCMAGKQEAIREARAYLERLEAVT